LDYDCDWLWEVEMMVRVGLDVTGQVCTSGWLDQKGMFEGSDSIVGRTTVRMGQKIGWEDRGSGEMEHMGLNCCDCAGNSIQLGLESVGMKWSCLGEGLVKWAGRNENVCLVQRKQGYCQAHLREQSGNY